MAVIKEEQIYDNGIYHLRVKESDAKHVTFEVYVMTEKDESLFGVQTLTVKAFKESLVALKYTLLKKDK